MKYWLMAHTPYATDFPWWLQTHSWTIYLETPDTRLSEQDIVFLANQERGIYAWGSLIETIESDIADASNITVGRGDIGHSLVDPEQINQTSDLTDILSFRGGKFTFLTNKQVGAINSWLPKRKAPVPRKYQFLFGQALDGDEGIEVEYKDVNLNQIQKHAYEYAIAFLGGIGGRILFGIRDSDKTVAGVRITYSQRDELNRTVENKLLTIVPAISPVKDYTIEFHNVVDSEGDQIPDLFVVELEVKAGGAHKYKSAGGKSHEKTYSGKRRIS